MRRLLCGLATVAALTCMKPAAADIVPRHASPAGSVIARKMGEEIRFIDVTSWRSIDLKQDLLPGDVLRTNAYGHLAILFSDRTQIRLGRNTTLLVKQIGAAADTLLGLQAGSIWGRAERGGIGLTVETPAAAAAIRGTDWSLTVDGDGRTSLIVLEGLVELANEFGSVSVSQGEAAVAAIGQAPTKIIIVDPDDREQMLFYLTLRGSFGLMPASPLRGPEMRAARQRAAGVPPAARTADDWVVLAETALSQEGRQAAAEAVSQARRLALSGSQRARLDLVEALIAAAEGRYREADGLFTAAAPKLDEQRRAVAAYGGYFSRALADPDRVEEPPPAGRGGAYGALAEAYAAGFLKDIKAAIDVLKRAEKRFPDDPTLPAIRAQFALLLDDREQVKEAVERALSIDPDDPTALEARANYKSGIESDIEGALADLTRAVGIAPGATSIWNALGLVQHERGAAREAEAALLRAIELDPQEPVSRANLAIVYLDQDRLSEAKAEIDQALALDPSFTVALIARGRYHLQTGEIDKALEDLLAGSTANPSYSQGLLLLAAGHYEAGDREPAQQALDNADRLDPNDPVVSGFRTAVAIDGYDAETAIDSAREALRRARERGGEYASLSANRDAGSLLNNAFRLQGLNAWGRFYGDAVFDPFTGSAFVDQAVSGSANPFANGIDLGGDTVDPGINDWAFSSLFQGLLNSPEMLSGRSRSANLLRRPFLEGAVGGGFVSTGGDVGWTAEAEVQGFAVEPVPWSVYGQIKARRTDEFRQRIDPASPVSFAEFGLGHKPVSGVGYVTARPTPIDRVVAYVDASDDRQTLDDATLVFNDPFALFDGAFYDRSVRTGSVTAGLGWSRTLGHRNVVNTAVFVSDLKQTSNELGGIVIALPPPLGPIFLARTVDTQVRQQTYVAAVNHTYGARDLTWRYGIEGGQLSYQREEVDSLVPLPLPSVSATGSFARAYADATYEMTPSLKAEAALFGTYLGGALDVRRIDTRAGLAWTPAEGHWLRAGYLRETAALGAPTLSPIGIVGLQSNQVPLAVGGYSDTIATRWDAEWSPRFFTSLDYQRQELHELAIGIPGGLEIVGGQDGLARGRLDRVSASANLRLGYGLGAFGTFAYTASRNLDPLSSGFGEVLPYVPLTSARLGLSWVNPSDIKLTLAATYIGPRAGDVTGTPLGEYWTADAFLTWEPFDKRFSFDLAAYNLFDQRFDVATGVPGPGRTFVGSFKVRF